MKHCIAWLVCSFVFAPALLTWGADGDRERGEQRTTAEQIVRHIDWTPDQKEKLHQLFEDRQTALKAIQDQIKPLMEQVKQLQEKALRPERAIRAEGGGPGYR